MENDTRLPSMECSSTETSKTSSVPSSRPVYFWKSTEAYGFLSNWQPSLFAHEGTIYANMEHWIALHKARFFNDKPTELILLQTIDPADLRHYGARMSGYDADKWFEAMYQIAVNGIYLKFTTGNIAAELKQQLLMTGDRELVMASPYCKTWGIGYNRSAARFHQSTWGQNLLGKALMEVRSALQSEIALAPPVPAAPSTPSSAVDDNYESLDADTDETYTPKAETTEADEVGDTLQKVVGRQNNIDLLVKALRTAETHLES
ncbi:hypothetical protein F4604DRAFT_1918635 [Suillus subluteus]|nr:hypothetical protein F4604DRAFT_1918635 [Suillus subluteus]